MKVIDFPLNVPSCNFTYFRVREGPNYFVSYYKHSSRLHYDPKDCWRVLSVAKFTDTGKALKEWCLEMDDTYSSLAKPEPIPDTSFASDEAMYVEPNQDTKTII